MTEQVVIECEDGNIVLDVDYDKIGKGADLDKLDADLKLISQGVKGVVADDYFANDAYDYDNHKWETPKGKLIGEIFALVDAGWEF